MGFPKIGRFASSRSIFQNYFKILFMKAPESNRSGFRTSYQVDLNTLLQFISVNFSVIKIS